MNHTIFYISLKYWSIFFNQNQWVTVTGSSLLDNVLSNWQLPVPPVMISLSQEWESPLMGIRSPYLNNGNSYTGKMSSLYWIGSLVSILMLFELDQMTILLRTWLSNTFICPSLDRLYHCMVLWHSCPSVPLSIQESGIRNSLFTTQQNKWKSNNIHQQNLGDIQIV